MKIDKLIKENNIQKKLKRLYYISFIKFIAMIIIIKWHISIWKKRNIDYGARLCELLYVSSGFLVGYNYYYNPLKSDYKTSFIYLYKHLKSFYPLYIINTIMDIYRSKNIAINKLTFIEIFIINFLLLQSWSRYKTFVPCFNGHTWFLSALMLCYFSSPFLLNGINKLYRALFLFMIISSVRIFGEVLIKKGAINLFDANFHYGPFVRLLEFYMGMLTVPIYFLIRFYLDSFRKQKIYFTIFFTIFQIFSPILIYIVSIKFKYIFYRGHFALFFSIITILFGFDYGLISNILSTKIVQIIISCQIEMYILQFNINHFIIKLLFKKNPKNNIEIEIHFIIKLIIIFTIAFLYNKTLKPKLTNIFDTIVISIISKI